MERNVMPTLGALGAGAALMYLLDPARGNRRRSLLRDKAVHFWHETADAVETGSRDLGHRARGVVAETAQHLHRGSVDDDTLCARVRAHLGHVVSHPHAVEVSARQGTVTLKGFILASEVQEAVKCVESTAGVKAVDNRLQVHEKPDVSVLMGGKARPPQDGRMTPAARLMTSALGGAMAVYGTQRRDPMGRTVGVAGIGMLARGIMAKTR